ncbi:MAG: hypothetical protein ABI333_26135 [bacterium]
MLTAATVGPGLGCKGAKPGRCTGDAESCYIECGNGIVDYDLGEVCDDGNEDSGDGCSADCRSDETCGNGYVDVDLGEECDATNLDGESCESLGYTGGGALRCDWRCELDDRGCVSVCGNGEREPDEACDGDDLGGETCEGLGLGGGTIGCEPDCRLFDVSGCEIQAECGDGAITYPEPCDGYNLGEATCESLDHYSGDLECLAGCTGFDTSGCVGWCGDGVVNGPETCDGTVFGSDSCQARGFYSGNLSCGPDCRSIDDSGCEGYCGDGVCDLGDGESRAGCPDDCSVYVAISAGGTHSCALAPDGTAWCWGGGSVGELGNGSTASSDSPVQVTGLTDAVAITAGTAHSCALLSDGTALCWGNGIDGQLGNGSQSPINTTPELVTGIAGVTAISAGYNHTCAVESNGAAWCWGEGEFGALGAGSQLYSNTPLAVSGLTSVVNIAAGEYDRDLRGEHSCAVLADGTARCWGGGVWGQLGDGSNSFSLTPVSVSGLTNAVVVSAGSEHSCAVASNGTAWCWGSGDGGILGNGSSSSSNTPVQVASLTNVTVISAGSFHTCAVESNGAAWCWGPGGLLGNGSWTESSTPVPVTGLTNAVDISAGDRHTCAVASDGTAWCWGGGGLLGDGSMADSYVPVQVLPPP